MVKLKDKETQIEELQEKNKKWEGVFSSVKDLLITRENDNQRMIDEKFNIQTGTSTINCAELSDWLSETSDLDMGIDLAQLL